MNKNDLIKQLEQYGVIPVIAIESAKDALPLADALIAGGLPIAEITFRTEAGAEAISLIKKKRSEVILGAGTILSIDQLLHAVDCGADFGVAPGLNEKIVEEALKHDFMFAPGVVTPTEIERALSYELKYLKFFPAEASGGVNLLKALYAPYRHLGIRFNPTGGINLGNMESYLSLEAVYAVGGSWVAKKDVIAAGRWDEITENARKIGDAVHAIRKSSK